MKLIFMGTPDFASANLKAIYDAGHEILAAVSQPDKPVGRHAELKPTAVKAMAMELGIPVLQPEKASDPAFIEEIKRLSPDVIVVTAYGRILKKELLDIPKYGCINVHASLLPRWRGAAPIQWSVIAGDKEVGVTAMQMNEGLDTGDILMVKKFTPAADETGGSLFDKLSILGGELIVDVLKELTAGKLTATPQGEEGASYASQLTKEMGNVDWTLDPETIERLIRGLYPWPGAYTFYNGKQLKLHKAALCDEAAAEHAGNAGAGSTEPGSVHVHDGRLFVNCGSGCLELLEVQLEGKKRMAAADFLRGNKLSGILKKER
ncbi:MAG: methionyl-tRNA formyltransferase [Eubacteriales bacterium]|nr:methionyl-tRNA formyltransferase [Eubacteriales bacterium]